jgi:hypothetical protein
MMARPGARTSCSRVVANGEKWSRSRSQRAWPTCAPQSRWSCQPLALVVVGEAVQQPSRVREGTQAVVDLIGCVSFRTKI